MLKVFMSYATEDRPLVQPYFARFAELGVDPWMDCEKLLPGQQWEAAIMKAFREAHVVILFMSPRSVEKRGFVKREANEAIQNLRSRHREDIYVIPLMIEKCAVPQEVAEIVQYLDLADANAWVAVREALRIAAEQQKISIVSGEDHPPFKVFTESLKDSQNGSPGHDIDILYPRFSSQTAPRVAGELTALFAGRGALVAASARVNLWNQGPDMLPSWAEADDDDDAGFSVRRNGHWEAFTVANSNPRFLSLFYTVSWYSCGAAHGNHHFEAFNFALSNGGIYRLQLQDFFETGDAIQEISTICMRDLERQHWRNTGKAPQKEDLEWIASGCSIEGPKPFECFIARPDGFTFMFSPYEVGPYAAGSFSVEVSYYDVLRHLRQDGPHTWARGA